MATLSSKALPTGLATSAQGALADSAVQPNDSPTFAATTLTGRLTLPTATYHYSSDGKARFYYYDNGDTLFRTADDFQFRNDANATVAQIQDTGAISTISTVTATSFIGDGSALTGLSGGETYDIQTFTSSGTWTRPTNYLSTDKVWVWVLGGGGGGGTDSNQNQAIGGNGGVGLYVPFDMSLLDATEPVVVGAGGAGATNNVAGTGSVGGNSSFGTSGTYGYIVGDGGNGGGFNDSANGQQLIIGYDVVKGSNVSKRIARAQNPYFGLAADGNVASTLKDLNATTYGGGCGASGGFAGGGGFSAWGGSGGDAVQNNGAQGNGEFPGGGGGSNDGDSGDGGDGAAGIVVVYTKRTVL